VLKLQAEVGRLEDGAPQITKAYPTITGSPVD
jgi:hypothetical protein